MHEAPIVMALVKVSSSAFLSHHGARNGNAATFIAITLDARCGGALDGRFLGV